MKTIKTVVGRIIAENFNLSSRSEMSVQNGIAVEENKNKSNGISKIIAAITSNSADDNKDQQSGSNKRRRRQLIGSPLFFSSINTEFNDPDWGKTGILELLFNNP